MAICTAQFREANIYKNLQAYAATLVDSCGLQTEAGLRRLFSREEDAVPDCFTGIRAGESVKHNRADGTPWHVLEERRVRENGVLAPTTHCVKTEREPS